MHVNATGTPPAHAAVHKKFTQPAPAETPTTESGEGALAPVAPISSPPTLSPGTLGAAIEAQSPGRSGETPAARARALIAEHPELAEQPFGQIVSRLARGLEIPLPADEPEQAEEPAPAVADEDPTVAPISAEDQAALEIFSSLTDELGQILDEEQETGT